MSEWIRDHLEVAVLAVTDRDPLADLEHRVLADLNPPLNLRRQRAPRMPPTPLRSEVSRLRATLA